MAKVQNPWDDKKIGSWEMNGDELHLYINMDERQFSDERSRLRRGRVSLDHVDRLTNRYLAYLAFHLFQLNDQSEIQVAAQNFDFVESLEEADDYRTHLVRP